MRAGSHIFAAVTGFILLTLAINLVRRKRIALLLTIGLLIISIVSNLLKGLDYEESLLSAIVLVLLLAMRDTLQGKAGKNLRTAINRFTKLGHQVIFYPPPLADELLQELRSVSDEWLATRQGSEKQFSLGWFDEAYLRSYEIAAVKTPEGQISAFANIIPEYQLNEITIDLMRKRAAVERGTMDFLFVSMFQYFKDIGYDSFNLGLSALSGTGKTQDSPRLEKALNYLYEHLDRFYNFQGLHEYKDKFQPRWEPRYLIYPSLAALPDVVVALIRADSGDRLLDYFKPGA